MLGDIEGALIEATNGARPTCGGMTVAALAATRAAPRMRVASSSTMPGAGAGPALGNGTGAVAGQSLKGSGTGALAPAVFNLAPQPLQNFAPSRFSVLHTPHTTGISVTPVTL